MGSMPTRTVEEVSLWCVNVLKLPFLLEQLKLSPDIQSGVIGLLIAQLAGSDKDSEIIANQPPHDSNSSYVKMDSSRQFMLLDIIQKNYNKIELHLYNQALCLLVSKGGYQFEAI